MKLTSWSPFREFDSLFDHYARELGTSRGPLLAEGTEWRPAATITETDKEYLIKADLPAVKRDDIDVTLENGVLTIKGERKVEKSSEGEIEHRREVYYGSFTRSFSVPDDVDQNAINADSKDGVLTVHLPKLEEARPKALSIKVK